MNCGQARNHNKSICAYFTVFRNYIWRILIEIANGAGQTNENYDKYTMLSTIPNFSKTLQT